MPASFSLILDGSLHPAEALLVPVQNRLFRYGDGLFETFRLEDGAPVCWEMHVRRMTAGMQVLGLELDGSDAAGLLLRELKRLMLANGVHGQGRGRIQLYRKGGGTFSPLSSTAGYLVEAVPLQTHPWEAAPVQRVCTFSEIPLSYTPLSPVKSCNSLPYILAARYAKANGVDDAVLLFEGKPAEASSSNVFAVFGDRLVTPPLTAGILPGVSRERMIAVAGELGFVVEEKQMEVTEWQGADEVIMSNSIRGIVNVVEWDGVVIREKGVAKAFRGRLM